MFLNKFIKNISSNIIVRKKYLPRFQRTSSINISAGSMGKNKDKRNHNYYDENMDTDDDYSGMSYNSSFEMSHIHSYKNTKMSKLVARNELQQKYIDLLENRDPPIIFATGPAGTAKTFLCASIGIKKLMSGDVEKLVLTRPAVSVEEEHGFLPGTLEQKMEPWMLPIYDVFYKYVSPEKLQALIAKKIIEICPLGYMRGRTFNDAFIIADEMQNSTPQQMLMILTRIGLNSKMIITGDLQQHDRNFTVNGLKDILEKLEKKPLDNNDISVIKFTEDDVVRHQIIKKILNVYK